MSIYEQDFYGWIQEQAGFLRSGHLHMIDRLNLLEEIEAMGRSEKRAVENRLVVLLAHLLKWKYQPDRRSNSWRSTIDHQRKRSLKIIAENPGLKPQLDSMFLDAYQDSIFDAAAETGLPVDTFPALCPWTFDQVKDKTFYPD